MNAIVVFNESGTILVIHLTQQACGAGGLGVKYGAMAVADNQPEKTA